MTVDPQPPRLASSVGSFAFGLVLLLAGGVSGLFTALPVIRWLLPDVADGAASGTAIVVILALFGPMTVILLGAAWGSFAYAITGRRGPMIHRWALWVLGAVLVALLASVAVISAIEGDIGGVTGAISGVGLLSLFWRYLRAKPQPPGRSGD